MKVLVKNEEDNEPKKYITQEDKNVEIEQQTIIEENEISKPEVKVVKPVDNIFHAKLKLSFSFCFVREFKPKIK